MLRFVGAASEIVSSRSRGDAETEQRQYRGRNEAAEHRPQLHPPMTGATLYPGKRDGEEGQDGDRRADPEPPEIAEPRQHLHRHAQDDCDDDRADRSVPPMRPWRGGDGDEAGDDHHDEQECVDDGGASRRRPRDHNADAGRNGDAGEPLARCWDDDVADIPPGPLCHDLLRLLARDPRCEVASASTSTGTLADPMSLASVRR